ncbi:MFS transporter [Schumannella luteola]|uniref:MFS family permease n=1 Tax=Schumannella luteola TaxID=472059 RepID=A0A852YAS1_9MICO|nr:MFS transporter [Schumannella luteola]NYG98384.1 MFS family permease [Schumannella luteola]TPX05800.1 MFS transporter [Schumannella luteola]
MEKQVIRRVTRRIIPFLVLLYVVAYIDRSNVGFAKLTLQSELGLSNAAFFMGTGMFFIAYALFEVPSNAILTRVGARRWFSRILISWGAVTMLTSLATGELTFYLARFLLGATEAGFYAGILFYLTKWYPKRHRAWIYGLFIFANPLSFVVGNPILGALSGLDGVLGIHGWQWIFLVTGLPAVILGVVTLRFLTDSPDQAKWLPDDERSWLTEEIARDDESSPKTSSILAPLRSGRVWFFVVQFLMIVVASYGLSFWLPTVVSGFGVSDAATGWLSAIPYVCGAAALYLIPRSADRRQEYFWHIAVPLVVAGVAMALSIIVHEPALRLAFMSVAAAGILGPQAVFWSLTSRLFNSAGSGTAIATVNSVGNLGGWLGPLAIGAIVDATGAATDGLWIIAGAAVVAAALVPGVAVLVRRLDRSVAAPSSTPASTPQ